MVCLLVSATEFQGSKVSEAWDGEAFVAPGKGGPGELEKTLFLGLRTLTLVGRGGQKECLEESSGPTSKQTY